MSALRELSNRIIGEPNLWSRSRLEVLSKDDGSPVTNVDLALGALIKEEILKEWPDLLVVSEEEPETHRSPIGRDVAIVDPLDGTENFVSGIPIWGVSVAVWKAGRHHASMLVFPELGLSLVTGDRPHLYTSRIAGHPSSTPIEQIARQVSERENRILGCAAFNLFCVATGRFSSFRNDSGAQAWDILGGLNLALEQGCTVQVEGEDYHGEFLDPSQRHRFAVKR